MEINFNIDTAPETERRTDAVMGMKVNIAGAKKSLGSLVRSDI